MVEPFMDNLTKNGLFAGKSSVETDEIWVSEVKFQTKIENGENF